MLFKIGVCALWIIVVHVLETNTTAFGIVSSMESLLETQKYVLESINSNVRNLTDHQKKLKVEKFISQCQKEYTISMRDVSGYLANPINSYRLIKRLASDLLPIEDILRNTNYTRNKKLFYPNNLDLRESNAILIILIYVYKLNVSDFADGTIAGKFSKYKETFKEIISPMTSSDCFELAEASFKGEEYKISLAFAKKTLYRYEVDCNVGCAFSKLDVVKFLSSIYNQIGDFKSSLKWLKKSKKLMLENHETRSSEKKSKTPDEGNMKHDLNQIEPEHYVNAWHQQHKKYLCFGDSNNPKGLHCEYRSGPHPFLRLARFKVEVLHLKPKVVMLHDVISDREIETLQKLSKGKSKNINSCDGRNTGLFLMRHISCLHDSSSKVVTVITKRTLDMTGLSKAAVQKIKVVEYGVGGYQIEHCDIANPRTYPNQDFQINARATVLFYMSNTKQGGATAFPEINLTVFPVKHSALIWSTMLPSGQEDPRTFHMSCPVLHGNKWVAVKWLSDPDIYYKGIENNFAIVSSS